VARLLSTTIATVGEGFAFYLPDGTLIPASPPVPEESASGLRLRVPGINDRGDVPGGNVVHMAGDAHLR
jgi:hypothetical protein